MESRRRYLHGALPNDYDFSMRTLCGVMLSLCALSACGDDGITMTDGRVLDRPGVHVKYPTVDGFNRSYALYIPESIDLGGGPHPVIMVLHGFPPVDMSVVTGMNEAAEREGFIAVYPKTAGNTEWTMACDECSPNAARGVDDVHFFQVVVEDLLSSVRADPARIYMTGFSNGGIMTFKGACELADEIAAFAPLGAGMWDWHMENCDPGRDVPMLMVNGTEDPQFPWSGVLVELPLVDDQNQRPVLETVSSWAARNGCGANPTVVAFEDRFDDATTVERWSYAGCRAETLFYKIDGGGHTWPSAEVDFNPALGTMSRELAATDSVVAFLLRQRR